MKNWVSAALLGLFTLSAAHAGLCSKDPGAIQDAQAALQKVQARFSVGEASNYDVLTAQKQVLELTLCQNSMDSSTYKALVDNTLARLHLAQEFVNAGIATSEDLSVVQAEVTGLAQTCPALLQEFKNEFSAGVVTNQDVTLIQQACTELGR